MALVKAVTSVLNAANRLYNQATCQKEESTLFSKKIEKEDVRDYDKALKDRLVSPLDDILDLDLNYLESDNNSKYIFPLSLSAFNNALNSKLVLTTLLHNTNILSKDLYSCITFVKDI